TGYGLDLDNEAKLLDVLRQLAGWTPLRVVPTFLGAHVPPPGIDRDAYVRSLIDEMLPAFTPWAVFCDAWCEAPAFTAKETRAILTRARALGYELRVHAAQLAPGEGPDIAAELRASSADHLEFATPAQSTRSPRLERWRRSALEPTSPPTVRAPRSRRCGRRTC